MNVWVNMDEPQRRRSSSTATKNTNGTGSLKVAIPEQPSNGYFNITKPSPTTSSVLANGSVTSPMQPLTPLPEATVATPKSPPSHKRSTSSATLFSPTKTSQEGATSRRKPLYIREGGSIPAIRFLEKEFTAPAAHFPCGQASDSAHLDNERLRLVNLYKSKEIFKQVFRELPQK